MSAVIVRVATHDDVEGTALLFDLYRQFYEQAPNLELATRFIRDRILNQESIILLAETSGREFVGFCQLYPTFCSVIAAPIYSLYDLYVLPQARRGGVGRALLAAAYEVAAQRGMARMDLMTARNNFPAQALYESLGWVRDEMFHAYHRVVED